MNCTRENIEELINEDTIVKRIKEPSKRWEVWNNKYEYVTWFETIWEMYIIRVQIKQLGLKHGEFYTFRTPTDTNEKTIIVKVDEHGRIERENIHHFQDFGHLLDLLA